MPSGLAHLLVTHALSIVGFVMATVLIAVLLVQRRAPGTTFAWLLAIVLAPYLGVPLYLVFGGRKLRGNLKRPLYARGVLAADGSLAAMLHASGAPPPRAGNAFELYTSGEAAYAAVLATLEAATRSIHVSTLILAADDVGDAVLAALERKARSGVEVRLLIDAMFKSRADRRRLRDFTRAGGKLAWFMPVWHLPFRRRLRANLRLHRKIIVVDDEVAIIGGMNLAREYMGPVPHPRRWRDLSALVRGPAVADIATVFRADWLFASGETVGEPAPSTARPASGSATLQVVGSGPDVADDLIYDAFLTAVFAARRRLWIATPYFVPDEALLRGLLLAIRRGVDVRIVVPVRSNHRSADYAGASYLRAVAAAGGKICCYLPTMMHGKAVLVDDDVAIVGSANLDMRSLFYNYEIAVLCASAAETAAIAAWFATLWPECGELAPAGRTRVLIESIARLVGPLE